MVAPLLRDLGLVFFHPPKTGGTSLFNYFAAQSVDLKGRGAAGNYLPSETRGMMSAEDWANSVGVLTVREPFARAVSGWKFFTRKTVEFDSWLDACCQMNVRMHRMSIPQVRFLPDDMETLIYKTEHLDEKFPGIRRLRETGGTTWQEMWTPERQRRISDAFAADYERFQYETPKP